MEPIKHVLLRPTLSLEEAEKKFKGRYLSHADYDLRPTKNTWGKFEDGTTAFIYLVNAIRGETFDRAECAVARLKFNDIKNSRRAGLKQSKGGELVLGYINFPRPRPMAKNFKDKYGFPPYYSLFRLLRRMGHIIHDLLPEYHEQQIQIAAEQPGFMPWLDYFPTKHWQSEAGKRGLKEWLADPQQRRDFPIFSTMTINKSTLFRSHADAKNEGGLACLTAFGTWSSGEFCLPRLRVAFPLQPGSLLIADNNNEQHGNIGPLVGNRISVVAYLRSMKAKTKAKAAGAGR